MHHRHRRRDNVLRRCRVGGRIWRAGAEREESSRLVHIVLIPTRVLSQHAYLHRQTNHVSILHRAFVSYPSLTTESLTPFNPHLPSSGPSTIRTAHNNTPEQRRPRHPSNPRLLQTHHSSHQRLRRGGRHNDDAPHGDPNRLPGRKNRFRFRAPGPGDGSVRFLLPAAADRVQSGYAPGHYGGDVLGRR